MSDTETLVRMPKLADTLVEGTVAQWLKQVGDEVGQGEAIASIETDKVTTEITSPRAGTVLELLVAEGQTVPIETPLVRIGAVAPTGITSPVAANPTPDPGGAIAAPRPTPVAARLLAEHGLDARAVASRAGRITRADVLRHLETGAGSAATEATPSAVGLDDGQQRTGLGVLVPLSSMRRAIADHMARAYETIPMGQTVMAADFTGLVNWRESHKDDFQRTYGANLTFTVLFVYALARQLANYTGSHVKVGVAVALDAGLIVPVLSKADTLTVGATAQAIADLAARARGNKLALDETQGAQMTVTNVGSFGNLTASPIVPLTQMGILGPGLVERRPLAGADQGIRLGWRCLLSLMFDRRILDDFQADRFLRGVVDELAHLPASARV